MMQLLYLGKGEFGSVFKGSYMTEQGVVKEVAIKSLSEDSIEPNQVYFIHFYYFLIIFFT